MVAVHVPALAQEMRPTRAQEMRHVFAMGRTPGTLFSTPWPWARRWHASRMRPRSRRHSWHGSMCAVRSVQGGRQGPLTVQGSLIVKMVLCQAENELLASLHIEQHSRTCMCRPGDWTPQSLASAGPAPYHCDEGYVMRAHKNAAAEARENECGSAPHRCACAHRHAQLQRDTLCVALGADRS